MMIILFENFINEKLGILNNLSDLADFIISKLKDTNYYQYTDNYKGTNISLNCFLVKKFEPYALKFFLLLALRLFRIFLPAREAIREKKPCFLALLLLFGWNVRFDI